MKRDTRDFFQSVKDRVAFKKIVGRVCELENHILLYARYILIRYRAETSFSR